MTAMTNWLVTATAPAGFSIDNDCLLKNQSSNASLRFSKHPLEDSVEEHIKDGKLPMELSMTWGDRVSFSLGADWAIKKIKLLDVVTADHEKAEDPIAEMNAEVMLDIGELLQIIPALIDAMGGEAAN